MMLPLCTSVTFGLVVVDGVLDGLAHQALGAFTRHRLDTHAGGLGKRMRAAAQLLAEEADQLARLRCLAGHSMPA
jgi:hypothetical protein